MVPPPPAAIGDLEEPKSRAPVFASRLNTSPKGGAEKDLQTFFEGWRSAWMARNFDGYMTHYAAAFSGSGTPALRWQTRRLRMVQGKSEQAELRFGPLTIEIEDDEYAQVSFAQHFEDGELSEIGTKQWQLRQINGRWLIEQEIFERRIR
jgi:hypothetical protein